MQQIAKTLLILTGATLLALAPTRAADKASNKPAKPYPLSTCVVSGKKLGGEGEPYVFTYQGREMKLCGKDCLKDFNKNPKKFVAKLEAAEKKAAREHPYPLKTCVVSGDTVGGDMGEPFVFVAEGREIKLCCPDCLKDFNKDRAKYLKKIAAAEKATR